MKDLVGGLIAERRTTEDRRSALQARCRHAMTTTG